MKETKECWIVSIIYECTCILLIFAWQLYVFWKWDYFPSCLKIYLLVPSSRKYLLSIVLVSFPVDVVKGSKKSDVSENGFITAYGSRSIVHHCKEVKWAGAWESWFMAL